MNRADADADAQVIPGPPPSALADYTGYLLRRASLRAQAMLARDLPPGRRATDLGILATVAVAGPVSQRRLGEILEVNRSMMVKLVDALETDGLLTREREPDDRRNYALRTTPAGEEVLAALIRHAADAEAEVAAPLTAEQHRRLVALLHRVVPDLIPLVPEALTALSGFLVTRAHVRVRSLAAGPSAELNIAAQQSGLLATLAQIEPCSQQRLATTLGVTGPAIVAGVTGLLDRGLISRGRNSDDRRENLLRLTADGRAKLAAAVAVADQVQQQLARQTGTAELAELNRLLARFSG
jgi:DNA-binding MarR family transcriptional regulator